MVPRRSSPSTPAATGCASSWSGTAPTRKTSFGRATASPGSSATSPSTTRRPASNSPTDDASAELREPALRVGTHEVSVDDRDCLVLAPWHEVTIEVERRLNRGVAEVRRNRFRVHPGGDQEAREGVPALV